MEFWLYLKKVWNNQFNFYRKESPDVTVTTEIGRSQSFEVTCNDELIYSKFETMGFPIEADIIEQVKKVAGGEEAQKVTSSHPPVDMKESVAFLNNVFSVVLAF